MSLNLHALAATVVRESDSPDPDDMVSALVARLSPDDYAEAIRSLARDLIRSVIRHERAPLNTTPTAGGSRKVEAARAAWRRLLDAPEYVPSAGWLFLRDASRAQVLEMAGLRAEKSRELAAAAAQYERLAEAMSSAGASTVADLPDETLARLLGPAAKAVAA